MANKDLPQGFRPSGVVKSCNKYVAGGTIYPGDAVKKENTGKIIAASAGDALIGIAATYASAADAEVMVWDDPDQRFVVQADETEVDAQTDILLNYDIVATAGNSTYRVSRMELDSSSQNTTATLPLKLLAVEARVDNALGTNVDCIVKINNHQLASGTGTGGV